jgi:hypothetical protein
VNKTSDSRDTWGNVLQFLGCLLIVILIVGSILMCIREPSVNECVAGGYATYRVVKGQGLCLGVNSDGEWNVETWDSVAERLGKGR